MHAKLAGLRAFLVGAGALGCEFLKNLALMGVASADGGLVTVTDDDTIEKSNLSRQFLFRDWDIGKFKATVAGAAASVINPAFKLRLLQNRVSVDTESTFNDDFWQGASRICTAPSRRVQISFVVSTKGLEVFWLLVGLRSCCRRHPCLPPVRARQRAGTCAGLDVVVNALDNVNARLYVDSRCVYFQLPLLESGTLGTKCNTQMVVPNMTENYGASRDPPERSAPMCTLHSFPHNIDHCLTWARSEFEGALEQRPKGAPHSALLDGSKLFLTARRAGVRRSALVCLSSGGQCFGVVRQVN